MTDHHSRRAGLLVMLTAVTIGFLLGCDREAAVPRASQTNLDDDALAIACREHKAQLLADLGDGHQALVRSPLVVAGSLDAAELSRLYDEVIGPAFHAMAVQYLKSPPKKPITILLFRDEQTYRDTAGQLYGDEPLSRFGYFKPHLRTLLTNIGTGTGTLLHELTHAAIASDFPEVPDWLDEGLASLHEESVICPDALRIDGKVNWRLDRLQEAIRENRLRSLHELITANDFRGELEQLNYAHARHFCLYMQRQGKLADCYRTMRDTHQQDPLGENAVNALFSDRNWEELDADFRDWVMQLSRE